MLKEINNYLSYAVLAQLVEPATYNREVPGSIPGGGTNLSRKKD